MSFFDYTLRETLANALDDEALKGKSYEMEEPGETYGFIFRHKTVPCTQKSISPNPIGWLLCIQHTARCTERN
jgi:hypothetical protein